MVTADRPDFARRAIASFAAQSWPDKELVVLDNGATPMRALLDGLPPEQVVYRHTPRQEGRYIGALRNESLEMARGDFVVPQWDDDDWSHPERLTIQAEVLLGGYDACALPGTLMHVDAPRLLPASVHRAAQRRRAPHAHAPPRPRHPLPQPAPHERHLVPRASGTRGPT